MKTMTIKKTRCELIYLTPKEGKYDEVKKMLGLYETDESDGGGNGHILNEGFSTELTNLCDDYSYNDNEGILDLEEEK